MELDQSTINKIRQMSSEGKQVPQISSELGVDYWQVWSHVEHNWQGTKWVITNRLNRLKGEKDQATRERYVNEVKECVQYLYDQGKRMGTQIDRARKSLNG